MAIMKVLQVVPSIGAESSGPSYSVPGLCRGLAVNGVDVSLHFLGNRPPHLQGVPYDVQNYPRHDRFNLGYSQEMRNGLKAACAVADIIHDNSLWMMPNVYPAWAVKGTKCKLVVAPRGTLAAWSLKKGWLKKKLFGMFLQNRVLREADMFHATSEKEYEEIRALGYKQPVAIVPIGMDVPEFKSPQSSGNRTIEQSNNQIIHRIAFFGRLHKVKAVDRLVQAWEIVNGEKVRGGEGERGRVEEWELVIAGPDNGIRAELERYIADHKIPRVRFVGEINGPAKYEFLSSADLYVLPSHTENFGVTVAEALACGTPVIVSKGTPWRGVEGESGEKGECGEKGENAGCFESRRALAERKVAQWLQGMTDEAFVEALDRLIAEKTSSGEYRFRRDDERTLSLKGAKRFFDEFSRKIIPLSDGRCVYFAPDPRAKERNGNDLARCWAEYAFHAVSSSGKMLEGRNFRERLYNSTKVEDAALIGKIVDDEHCMFRLIDNHPENDAIIFIGRDANGGRIEIVTRLDEYGNAQANLGEVTVIVQHARKKTIPPPKFRPLTEVVETVAKHQAAGFSPSTTEKNVANIDPVRKGKMEESCQTELRMGAGRCGWWVDNDPETLAKTLREAIEQSNNSNNRTILQEMGENGREWIRRDFSWEGVGVKMKAAYEWLLNPDKVKKPEWVKI